MSYTKISTEDLIKWLKANLCEERFEHSLGTAECAKDLAYKFNLDIDKAYIAGLLHDCAKCFPNEKLLEIIDTKMDVEPIEKMSPKTLHAPVSSYVAKSVFGVDDEEILSAVRWHTLGKLNMSDFEKIIYLADKIEFRTRKKEHAEPIRRLLDEPDGLNQAMLQSYKQTIISLVERDLVICPLTVDIYNSYERSVNC